MKVFRLALTYLGTTYVEADSCTQDDVSIRFYRAGRLLAEYATSTVKNVEATSMQPQLGLFSILTSLENAVAMPKP